MNVVPGAAMNMGKTLALWFVYTLVVSFFAAYITSRAVAPGTEYLTVFRFIGTTAFMGYALGPDSRIDLVPAQLDENIHIQFSTA